MFQCIELHIVRGSHPAKLAVVKESILFGASELPSRLSRLFNRPFAEQQDFRVFPTLEEAEDPSNSGHSVPLLCQHIDKDRWATGNLLKSGGFVFNDSGRAVVAYVRVNDHSSPAAATSNAIIKPQGVKRTSAGTAKAPAPVNRHRPLSKGDSSEVARIVTYVWPRDDNGVPLDEPPQRRNSNGVNVPTWHRWVINHLYMAFEKSFTDEWDVSVLMQTAKRMAHAWRSDMMSHPPNYAVKIFQAERTKTWQEGEYGKLWRAGNRCDPGELLIPSLRTHKTNNKRDTPGPSGVGCCGCGYVPYEVLPEGISRSPHTVMEDVVPLKQQNQEEKNVPSTSPKGHLIFEDAKEARDEDERRKKRTGAEMENRDRSDPRELRVPSLCTHKTNKRNPPGPPFRVRPVPYEVRPEGSGSPFTLMEQIMLLKQEYEEKVTFTSLRERMEYESGCPKYQEAKAMYEERKREQDTKKQTGAAMDNRGPLTSS